MIELSPELITKLEKVIGLPFVNDPFTEGNLCFADNKEVRVEYRETFNSVDVTFYLAGVKRLQDNRHQHLEITPDGFPFPSNANQFWKMVETGSLLR